MMNFLIFGAGAIGSYVGGSLILAGQKVVFIERPELAPRLRRSGLQLKIGDQVHVLTNLKVSESPDEALAWGDYDIAIFALKSYDTTQALEMIAPHSSRLPPFLCLQNGVDNESELASVLGTSKVMRGSVTSAIGRSAPGEISLERLRGVGIAGDHPLSAQVVQTFNLAGLGARLYPDGLAMKWSKLLTNLLANATSAILDLTPAEIYANPGLYRLEVAQLKEALAVMDAQNLQAVNLPGTPVRLLTFALRSLPWQASRLFVQRAVGSGRGAKMPSLHIDLYSGRQQSEVSALNGAVVRHGEKLHVPTPVNRLLTQTLLQLVEGKTPRATFSHNPDQLLCLWNQ